MNKKNSEKPLSDSQGWFYDRYLAREVEARRYLLLCGLLGGLLALSIIVWIILLPLKRTLMEPYVVLIDDISGITATLTAAKTSDLAEHTPVQRYFLAKYVQAREGYNLATVEQQIDRVKAFSSPEAFATFQGEWENPQHQEERQKLGLQGEQLAEILSVTFPLPEIAHVRYTLTEKRSGNVMNSSTWLATLKLAQVEEVDNQLAILNPLGLVIINYETIRESNHVLSDQVGAVSSQHI